MTDRDTAEMRAAFESDYFGDVPDVKGRERSGSGYKYSVVQSAWSIWRAAWTAALASPPVAVQEERDAKSSFEQSLSDWAHGDALDAARYRWIRENADVTLDEPAWFETDSGLRINVTMPARSELDRAIDAAMKGDQP